MIAILRTAFASLRVGLIVLTLVVLVPALGLLIYIADQDREKALDEVKSNVLHLARLAAAEESQIIQSTRQLLQQVAQTPEARGETSPAACDEMVARQIKAYAHYSNLGVIRPDGIRFCGVLLPGNHMDLSSRAFFRRAVETRDFSVGDYQVLISNKRAGVGLGYPVINATGELRGVAFATLDLEWLGKSLARAQLPPEASLTVVDSKGNMLARFPDTEGQLGRPIAQAGLKYMLAQGGSGSFEGIASDGSRRVWGFVPLHQSASGILFVRVGMPVAAAYAVINRAFYRNLLLIAATALLIMGVAWTCGERLVMRPVRRLTSAARRLGTGDLSGRTGLPHGNGEFGELARVFDSMADSIQSEGAALARLVAQQTDANAQLVAGMSELERRNIEMTELSRMSQVLQTCQNLAEACAAVAQSGKILFPAEVAALYLMRASRNYLEYKTGWGGTEIATELLTPESCWALRSGQVYRFDQPQHGLPCEHVTAEHAIGQYICVPLAAQGDILGLVHIRFPTTDVAQPIATIESRMQLAATFAVQAGLALANLKLREVLKEQSMRDPLTGLHNRRFLEETFERELSRAQRKNTSLAVIMADVDHFKRFNDTHGHDAGDAVLRGVAQALNINLRESDVACRFGGEEFTLILPESTPDGAQGKAELLRQQVAALELSHAGQKLGTVTMSFGVAMFPAHGSDCATLLKAADLALYRAKNEGRNRVAIAQTATPDLAAESLVR